MKKFYKWSSSTLVIGIAFTVFCILAAMPVLAYAFRAQVAIQETAGNSYDMLGANWTQRNTWLANNGFMNSTANDTRVQTLGGIDKPHMVADNKTLVAVPVGAYSQNNLYFVTGEAEQENMHVIPGYGGYVTTLDNAALELGDNFTASISGWIDTDNGTAKYLIDKDDAFTLRVSDNESGLLQSGIYGNHIADTITDVSASWTNEANASDGATATAATEAIDVEWTGFIQLSFNKYILSDGIKFYAGIVGHSGGDLIDIDAYYNGGWQDVYQGTFTDDTSTTKTYTDSLLHSCNGTRVRIYNAANNGETARVGELQINGYYPYVTASGLSSGEQDIQVGMESPFYGMQIDDDLTLPVANGLTLNAPLWQTELDANPWSSVDGTVYTGTLAGSPNPNWTNNGYDFDPNGYITVSDNESWDFAGDFTLEAWVYNNALNGCIMKSVSDQNWGTATNGDWLCHIGAGGKAYLYLKGGTTVSGVTVTTTGSWYHIVYTRIGNALKVYVDGIDDTSGTPTSAATYGNTNALELGRYQLALDGNMDGYIGELRIYNGKGLSPTEVLQNYNATKWKYKGDTDNMMVSTTLSVPNNANSYQFMYNATTDFMPYAEYIKLAVDGTQVAWYQPNSIIETTVLPNRVNPGTNDGAFTWGGNPAGVSVSVGSMESSGQSAAIDTSTDPTSDILPEVGGSDWDEMPDTAGTLAANPFYPVVEFLGTNTTLSEMQWWRIGGIVLVAMVIVLVGSRVRGHHLITGIMGGAMVGLMVQQTIFPIWALVFSILLVLGGIISERARQL